jgi:hypothetical protein
VKRTFSQNSCEGPIDSLAVEVVFCEVRHGVVSCSKPQQLTRFLNYMLRLYHFLIRVKWTWRTVVMFDVDHVLVAISCKPEGNSLSRCFHEIS